MSFPAIDAPSPRRVTHPASHPAIPAPRSRRERVWAWLVALCAPTPDLADDPTWQVAHAPGWTERCPCGAVGWAQTNDGPRCVCGRTLEQGAR